MKTGIGDLRVTSSESGHSSGTELASLGTVRRYLADNYRHRDGAPIADADAARVALRRISLIEHGVRRLCRARDVGDEIARVEGLTPHLPDTDEDGDGW